LTEAQHREADQPLAAIVCPRYPYPAVAGGIKRSLRLAECMDRAGLRVVVFTDDYPSPEAVEVLNRRGWDTHVARVDSSPLLRRVQQHVLRLPGPRSGALAHELTDTVRRRGALIQLEGVVAASHLSLPLPTPVIFSTQNVEAQLAQSAVRMTSVLSRAGLRQRYHAHRVGRTESRTARRAEAIICVSQTDAETFEPLAKRIVLAPNGVDDEFFAVPPAETSCEDVLFFGQLTYPPNMEGLKRFLTEGWPVLARTRPHSRLMIAGEGSREGVEPIGSEASRVVVLGLVDDMSATVAKSRLTLVPIWRGGGTRLKVLEALAAMRPVVGTSLGVSGVGFESGRHGLVAETPVELARAAATMLEQTSRTGSMAEEGRLLAKAYRWKRVLEPAEQLYRDYAAGPKSRE
jgi:glycosyltransferase involved in cell wall biosynthesis